MAEILLVDDHVLVREAIANVLRAMNGVEHVAEAGSAEAALDAIARRAPTLVLMDIAMPGMSCFDAARVILDRNPHIRIVFLSGFESDEHIRHALAAGAHGFILKSADIGALRDAVQRVLDGDMYFSPSVMSRLVITDGAPRLPDEAPKTRVELLSRRERELLRLIAQGMSLKAIATQLGISYKTADNHKTNLMRKLNIHDRVELTRFAIREGLAEA